MSAFGWMVLAPLGVLAGATWIAWTRSLVISGHRWRGFNLRNADETIVFSCRLGVVTIELYREGLRERMQRVKDEAERAVNELDPEGKARRYDGQ